MAQSGNDIAKKDVKVTKEAAYEAHAVTENGVQDIKDVLNGSE